MEKIYIVEHLTNGLNNLPITHVDHIFRDYNKAAEWLENEKRNVENKTSYHFKDREWGWLNPILDDEYSVPQIHIVNAVTYKWTSPNNGETMFTHFKILEYEVE